MLSKIKYFPRRNILPLFKIFFMRFLLLIIGCLLLFTVVTEGQVSQGGFPVEIPRLKSASDNVLEMPGISQVEINAIMARNREPENLLKPFRFAHTFPLTLSTQNSGNWFNAPNGTRIWRLKIRSKGAKSLNLIFNHFELPAGSRMFLFNEKENHYLGAFTSDNNKKSKKFAISPVAGDEIIVQYEVPPNVSSEESFEIGSINHDFIGILKYDDRRPLGKIAGNCNIDINCEISKEWKDVKDAVCRFIVNGREICSGVLINNSAEDQKPYILSAAHCYDKPEYAETTVYTFNYESPYCAPIDGDPGNSVSGAFMKATFDSLDFALTELSLVPPPEYRPFFAGWNRSATIPDSSVSIHHPQGDVKKIAFDYHPPEITDFNSNYTENAFFKILRWDEGVTEVGSSGGPLFNNNQEIIGTLTGGVASCINPVKDYFERFELSWDYKSDSAKQLKCWLDPIESGVLSIPGKRYYVNEDFCAAFNHLNDEDQHQVIPIYSLGKFSGYWGGTNSIDIDGLAERFTISGNEILHGVSMGVAKILDTNDEFDSEIDVNVYNGGRVPESLVYSKTIKISELEEDAMNFISFDELVETSDTFFVGFELNGMQPKDTFVVYQSLRDEIEGSFYYFKRYDNWTNYRESYDKRNSLTSIFEVVACNVGDIVNDTPLINNPLEIIVYPNPTHERFTLEAGENIRPENISVYNLIGKEVGFELSSKQKRRIQIDLQGNIPGVYFVRYKHKSGFTSKKISYLPW